MRPQSRSSVYGVTPGNRRKMAFPWMYPSFTGPSWTCLLYTSKLPTFGYDWTVTGRWGNGTSVIADTAHPLEAQEDLTTVTLSAGEEVSLHFSKLPDSVTVTYWSADETDRENSTQVETTFLDSSFHFIVPEITGQMVILISGTWSSYDDVSGTVNYAFRTAA